LSPSCEIERSSHPAPRGGNDEAKGAGQACRNRLAGDADIAFAAFDNHLGLATAFDIELPWFVGAA
jgi:hypothetical protein